MSNWDANIQGIRDSIILLKNELETAEPKDSLDAAGRILQSTDFMRQSNIGWAHFLSNPSMVDQLDEEALKDVFSRFKRAWLSLESTVMSTTSIATCST